MAVYELNYQRLQGPRRKPGNPSVAIALSDLRVLRKRKSLRLATSFTGLLAFLAVLLVVARSGILKDYLGFLPVDSLPAINQAFFGRCVGFSPYQLALVLLAMFAGSGRIAEDLRTNALAIYLSKPLTRGDYLLGKTLATASVVALGAIGAPLLVYLVAALTDPAFLAQNIRTGLAIAVLGMVATAYHTAAILFFSSLVRNGRVAGLLFGTLYFISTGVKEASAVALRTTSTAFLGYRANLQTLAAHLFGRAGEGTPPLAPALVVIALVIVVGFTTARGRVRAVEVVT